MTQTTFGSWLVIGLAVFAGCGGDCKGSGCGDDVVLTVDSALARSAGLLFELCLDNGQEQPCVSLTPHISELGGPLQFRSLGVYLEGRLTLTVRTAAGEAVSTTSVDVNAKGPTSTCSGDCKVPTLALRNGVLSFSEI